jgi:serine/threonine-protein kinase
LEAAGRDFERAIEISPDYPTSHQWYAVNYLTPLGRFAEAIREIRLAQALDPLSLVINASVGLVLSLAGEYDEAVSAFKETLEIDADFALAHFFLGRAYVRQSMYEEAIAALEGAVALAGDSAETRASLGHAYGASGRREEARAVLEDLVERSERQYVSPVLIAQVLIGLDERGEAMDWLEKAVESRAADLVWLKVRPIYDVVRTDPRFASVIERLGLS